MADEGNEDSWLYGSSNPENKENDDAEDKNDLVELKPNKTENDENMEETVINIYIYNIFLLLA